MRVRWALPQAGLLAGAHWRSEPGVMRTGGGPVHDIIGAIIDWDEELRAYLAGAGQTGERYNQRPSACLTDNGQQTR
jgi:hypothetical protein